MVPTPRVQIGTLFSGENEFRDCVESIEAQEGVQISHHIITNLPEYQAHNELWAFWEAHKHHYDLLIKFDADCVFTAPNVVLKIWRVFESDSTITGVQPLVRDYFSDTLITAGITAFRPTVKFAPSSSKLLADHADSGHSKVLRGKAVQVLTGLVEHAPNPGIAQAVFYGYHRRLKGQFKILGAVKEAYKKRGGEGRRWALIGAHLADRDNSIILRARNHLKAALGLPSGQVLNKEKLVRRAQLLDQSGFST